MTFLFIKASFKKRIFKVQISSKVLEENFQQDVTNIQNITIVPTLLNVICQTTGMGFAAVARVTEDRWITCSVQDNVAFGLKPGDELQIKTTICDEIRQDRKAVIIDNVSEDPEFRYHHTPAMYGLQSYISVPIMLKDGSFFGTLCAIDPKPNSLKTFKVREMFNLFADLISFHITSIEEANESKTILKEKDNLLEKTEIEKQKAVKSKSDIEKKLIEKNISLEKMNNELEAFNYISSHDLQEPLRKIQLIISKLLIEIDDIPTQSVFDAVFRVSNSAKRMQTLLQDILKYTRIKYTKDALQKVDLNGIMEATIDEMKEVFNETGAVIEYENLPEIYGINFLMKQLFSNIIQNSLKYAAPDKLPVIKVTASQEPEIYNHANKIYCNWITFTDNGIGFEQEYADSIFKIFTRLHSQEQYSGSGVGLALCKKIMQTCGGNIQATGKPGEGTAITIYFPCDHLNPLI